MAEQGKAVRSVTVIFDDGTAEIFTGRGTVSDLAMSTEDGRPVWVLHFVATPARNKVFLTQIPSPT